MASPLIATQFSHIHHWSFHFLVSLGIAISNTIVLCVVFRFKSQDGKSSAAASSFNPLIISLLECLVEIGQPIGDQGMDDKSKFRQILSHKTVQLLAFFILVYVGVEVTIGGKPGLALFFITSSLYLLSFRVDCYIYY